MSVEFEYFLELRSFNYSGSIPKIALAQIFNIPFLFGLVFFKKNWLHILKN